MSDPIKTMAVMVANRASDIEATRELEKRKLADFCDTLTGSPRQVMEKHHPELFKPQN